MRVVSFLKRTAAAWFPALVCTLIVCATVAGADPYGPFGGFAQPNIATSQSGCSDLGAGLGFVNNSQVCIPASIAEAITLTAASTAFTVNNNATISGTLTTGAITSSGLHTLSSTTPELFTSDASTGATGVALTTAGTGLLTTSNPEWGLTANNTTVGTNGCPDTTTGSGNLMYLFNNSAAATHGLRVFCNGSVSITSIATPALQVNGTETVSGLVTGGGFTAGNVGTQFTCSATGGCEDDYAATSAPGETYKTTGSLSNGSVDFQWIGGSSNSTALMQLLGNGGLTEQAGTFTNSAGDIVDTAGNIHANGTANATGEISSGNAGTVTGAKGVGAIVAAGTFYEGTFCSVANGTTSNATPSLLTLPAGGWACKITSGSASATVFNITFPGSVTLTNAPICDFTPSITPGASYSQATQPPNVTSSTTLCTLTYGAAPGAVLLGNLDIKANGI